MDIQYRTRKLEKECLDFAVATKAYGDKTAKKLHQRIDEICAANSIELLVKSRIGDCHPLRGDRKGEYAMALEQPFRLIFRVIENLEVKVLIVKIENYH